MPSINVDLILKVLGVAGGILSLGFGAFLWAARREWVTRQDFAAWTGAHAETHDELDQRLDRGEVRFERLEGKIDHLATREDLGVLTKSLSDVAASVNGLRVAVDAVDKSVQAVNRLTQMLIENELKQGKS